MVSNCSRYFSSLVPERVRKVTTAAWKGGRNHEHDCRQHIDLIMVTLFITYLVGLRQSKPLLLLGESTRRSAAAVIRPDDRCRMKRRNSGSKCRAGGRPVMQRSRAGGF